MSQQGPAAAVPLLNAASRRISPYPPSSADDFPRLPYLSPTSVSARHHFFPSSYHSLA